ncbi:MAG: hypothetical protein ACKPJD_19660, partial [Planctomycetaceae bacterium]
MSDSLVFAAQHSRFSTAHIDLREHPAPQKRLPVVPVPNIQQGSPPPVKDIPPHKSSKSADFARVSRGPAHQIPPQLDPNPLLMYHSQNPVRPIVTQGPPVMRGILTLLAAFLLCSLHPTAQAQEPDNKRTQADAEMKKNNFNDALQLYRELLGTPAGSSGDLQQALLCLQHLG